MTLATGARLPSIAGLTTAETAARLAVVVEAQRAIACAPPDPAILFALAIFAVQQIAATEGACAFEVTDAGLVTRARAGTIAPQVGEVLPGDTTFAAEALRSGESLLIRDAFTDPRGDSELARAYSMRSALIVPLIHHGVPVAVLNALSSRPDAFDEADHEFLSLIAEVTSGKLAHALANRDRDTARTSLEASERQFRLAFDHAPSGMVLVSLEEGRVGTVLQANACFAEMIGRPVEQVLRGRLTDWLHPGESDTTLIERLSAQEVERVAEEHRFVHADGTVVHVHVAGAVARSNTGAPMWIILHCLDISERKQAEAELQRLALTDPLTGLANRTLLEDRVNLALARMQRSPGGLAVLLIDLDRFKPVNDALGHHVADTLLVEVARRLRSVTRPGTTVARLGGDEFVVLLDELVESTHVGVVTGRLLQALSEPYDLPGGGQPRVITASIGIAVTHDAAQTSERLLREADLALHRAKVEGRNRAVFFEADMSTQVVARMDAEQRLRRALDHDGLVLVYQPVVSLTTGRINGAEALVRIADPELGMLAPAAFIDVAEETGLIVDLDLWVVEHAVEQLGAWRAGGLTLPSLAVNLSAQSLEDHRVAAVLRHSLHVAGVDGGSIHIELTERTFLHSTPGAQRALATLRDLGVQIGIDDFGTGYSALAYLQNFTLDFMKVDRSFVMRVADDARGDAVVAAIVDLAHAHDLQVIAEGVEEPRQLAALRVMSCDAAQGYLMGRPMSAALLAQEVNADMCW